MIFLKSFVFLVLLLAANFAIADDYCDGSTSAYNQFCEGVDGEIACQSTSICVWVHDGGGAGTGSCDGTNDSNPSCQPLDQTACQAQAQCTWYE